MGQVTTASPNTWPHENDIKTLKSLAHREIFFKKKLQNKIKTVGQATGFFSFIPASWRTVEPITSQNLRSKEIKGTTVQHVHRTKDLDHQIL